MRETIVGVAVVFLLSFSVLRMAGGQQGAESYDILGLAAEVSLGLMQGPADVPGTAAHLRRSDPFQLYWVGRNLTQKSFSFADGALLEAGASGPALYVDDAAGGPRSVSRLKQGHASSCGFCHSLPHGEPGTGQTINSHGPAGRRTPHFFGAGLVESVAMRIRNEILEACNASKVGWITRAEAEAGCRARVRPGPHEEFIDYGDVSPDQYGIPKLNSIFRIWFVDESGRPLRARSLYDRDVAGFDFAVGIFGWGRGTRAWSDGSVTSEGGEAASIRELVSNAARVHIGLRSADPVQVGDRRQGQLGGRAGTSVNGALQFDFGQVDLTEARGPVLTAGDLDAIEFFVLHFPSPAILESARAANGAAIFRSIGCATCHSERWQVDMSERRQFSVYTATGNDSGGAPRIELRLKVDPPTGPEYAYIYSDFKHWDIGWAFYETRFDGTVQKVHRTAPLWGVGSSASYGHNGKFPSLHSVIDAHAGAADRAANAYRSLEASSRADLLFFLNSLRLYSTLSTPADVDGDGAVSEQFVVKGVVVGQETFVPSYLAKNSKVPPVVCCAVTAEGAALPLYRPLHSTGPQSSGARGGAP